MRTAFKTGLLMLLVWAQACACIADVSSAGSGTVSVPGSGSVVQRADLRQFLVSSRVPESVSVVTESRLVPLIASHNGTFTNDQIRVGLTSRPDGVHLALASPEADIKEVRLTWKAGPEISWLFLGDTWERGYGDLGWRALDERRVLPWYFLVNDGRFTVAAGVRTSPSAFCSWTVTTSNITFQADVRSGGIGVRLGSRVLEVCTITSRAGVGGETPFQAAQAFCRMMCSNPRFPSQPVYGMEDWYYSNGNNTAETFLSDASYVSLLTANLANRPFAVIDAGWQAGAETVSTGPGPWDQTNPRFSRTMSMPQIAGSLRSMGLRPGLWWRPLIAGPNHPEAWRLSRDASCLDISVPAVRSYVRETMAMFSRWGFDLIKPDFSTRDISGRWGSDMVDGFTGDGWTFADRTRTSAELIRDFYSDLRIGAGNRTLIEGCNTVGHLGAGFFDLQRIGDDNSGTEWSRTVRSGVNSLAFRAPQHGTFFCVDAGGCGQVDAGSVPWGKNRQWLDLLARSGTPLFVSFSHGAVAGDQEITYRAAMAAASGPHRLCEPLDWMDQRTPSRWRLDGVPTEFSW